MNLAFIVNLIPQFACPFVETESSRLILKPAMTKTLTITMDVALNANLNQAGHALKKNLSNAKQPVETVSEQAKKIVIL